ncbi:MAG: DUF4352 domain-containing protein [Bacillota bacterium]
MKRLISVLLGTLYLLFGSVLMLLALLLVSSWATYGRREVGELVGLLILGLVGALLTWRGMRLVRRSPHREVVIPQPALTHASTGGSLSPLTAHPFPSAQLPDRHVGSPCPKCGNINPVSAAFCSRCGHGLSRAGLLPSADVPTRQPQLVPQKTISKEVGQRKTRENPVAAFLLGMLLLGGGVAFLARRSDPPSQLSGDTTPQASAPTRIPPTRQQGELVRIGYTTYRVDRAYWANQLGDNEFLNARPDAAFLIIEITVLNNDRKARTIPPFKLLDERSAEYEETSKAWGAEGKIGALDSLNPGVAKHGKLVFDVPRLHQYRLKVLGGFWSADEAFIEIAPR